MSNKKLWKRILIWTGSIILGLIILSAITIGIVLHTVFTPKKITPIVSNLANEYLNAELECESVELTFFSTFPNFGVVLKDGIVINPLLTELDSVGQEGLPQDTLVAFQRCIISFNPIAFLTEQKIIINNLKLDNPNIYAYVNHDNKANWDIISKSENTVNDADTTSFQLSEIEIKGLRIANANIIYDNRMQNLFVAANKMHLDIDGNMSKESSKLRVNLEIKSLLSFFDGKLLSKRLPLSIKAELDNNRISQQLDIKEALITAGTFGFGAFGILQIDSILQQLMVDLKFGLNSSSLSDLLQSIPQHILKADKNMKTAGKLNFEGHLNGNLGKDSFPLFTASVNIKDGALGYKNSKKTGLKTIEFNGNTQIDLTGKTDSYFHIENINLQSASSSIKLSGRFDNIFTDPFINADVKTDIDFNRLLEELPFADSIQLGGTVQMNLVGGCFLNDILSGDLGEINASGKIDFDDVLFKSPDDDIDFYTSSIKLRLGNSDEGEVQGQIVENLLHGGLEIDSIYFNLNNKISVNASKFLTGFFTMEPEDENSTSIFVSSVQGKNMYLNMGDSIRVRSAKTEATLKLVPSTEDKSNPELTAQITLDNLRGRMPEIVGRITDAGFNVKIKQLKSTTQQQDQTSYLAFQSEIDEKRKFQNLDISGRFECNNMNLRTPAFPLPMSMVQSSFDFTTNKLSLNQTHFKVGDSEMILTGEIIGIQQAVINAGQIKANVKVESDMLDCNQIIRAFASGSEYLTTDASKKDSIAQIILDDTQELVVSADTTTNIFVVPQNIDFVLDTEIKNVHYNNLSLNNVSGKVLIRNQSIQLSELTISSEVGSTYLSFVYKSPDAQQANIGVDLQMHQIYIKELISAFPIIDTLAPMLRSFEGVVDCNIAAITSIDSLSNIILPETSASCHLKGKDMVLMDGETFAEISKMLMFKNKERNLVDSISVEIILDDGKIMIFPFQMSLDRYIAGIGGTQNLDMSFDYHISILKSPLPLKLGLNITGTPDKMKFRLAKAKYKDLLAPATEKGLNTTHINLRQQMEESLRKSIVEIINEPLSAPIERPQIILNDSLRMEYFQSDTTDIELPEDTTVETEQISI